MEIVKQELEPVEVRPNGEIRARHARHIRYEDGSEEYEWHRASYPAGTELPTEVADRVRCGEVVLSRRNEAYQFLTNPRIVGAETGVAPVSRKPTT
jgi:hypothetical protein